MHLRHFASVLLSLLLILALTLGVCALDDRGLTVVPTDFGDFGGGDDYGGGDYGGWDDGGDYDYDYGSDYGSSSSGDITDNPVALLVIIVIIVLVVISNKNKSAQKRPVNIRPTATDTSTLRPMSEYLTVDPDFDEAAFNADLAKLYVQLQNAWCARDLTPLRPYLTDTMLGQAQSQIDNYIRNGQTPHTDRISVLAAQALGWKQDSVNDTVICRMQTRIVDYVTDDRTGEVVNGSNTAVKFMEYEWTMIRTAGKHSAKAEGTTQIHCESCGAPLDVNHSAVCPYCGSVVTSSEYGWTLSNIRGISQQTQQ